MNFASQIFLNDISHGYRVAIIKKNYLWLLPFHMAVAIYFCYEKVHKTMRTAIASNLLKVCLSKPQIIYLSIYISVSIYIYIYIYIHTHTSIYLSIYLSIYILAHELYLILTHSRGNIRSIFSESCHIKSDCDHKIIMWFLNLTN